MQKTRSGAVIKKISSYKECFVKKDEYHVFGAVQVIKNVRNVYYSRKHAFVEASKKELTCTNKTFLQARKRAKKVVFD